MGTSNDADFQEVLYIDKDSVIRGMNLRSSSYHSPSSSMLLRYGELDLFQKPFCFLFKSEEEAKKHLGKSAAGRGINEEEALLIDKDGEPIACKLSTLALFDGTGELVGYVSSIRSVKHEQEASKPPEEKENFMSMKEVEDIQIQTSQNLSLEEEKPAIELPKEPPQLHESCDKLSAVLQRAKAGTFTCYVKAERWTLDQWALKLFDANGSGIARPFEELWKSFILETDYSSFCSQYWDAIKNENSSFWETEFRTKPLQGIQKSVMLRASIERNRDREAIRMDGMIWDITQLKRLEQERIEAVRRAVRHAENRAEEAVIQQRKNQEFVDTICHEIRNPLNAIFGAIDILETQFDSLSRNPSKFEKISVQINELLVTLKQTAQQQKTIVDDVLDLSKLDAQKTALITVPFNPRSTFNTIIEMFTPQAHVKEIKLFTSLPTERVWITGDPNRISLILSNFLSNAIKFTSEGYIKAEVMLHPSPSTSEHETELHLRVEDTGIGMTDEEIKKLFVPFTQTAAHSGGTGLGLTISEKLTKLMGGKIYVKSEKGKGSVFTAVIPTTITKEPETVAAVEVTKKRKIFTASRNALVVDDNVMNCKILNHYLNQKGHFCHIAENGEEAVKLYSSFKFDIVLMDIEMPVMNGIDATKKIRELEQVEGRQRVPIIGLSGAARAERIEAARESGMDDYLTKPYHKEELYRLIDTLTASPVVSPTSL